MVPLIPRKKHEDIIIIDIVILIIYSSIEFLRPEAVEERHSHFVL